MADNPPFGHLDTIIDPWVGDPPLPTLPIRAVIPSVTVTGTNPPFGHLDTIIDPWVGDPPLPILPFHTIPKSPDPPFTHFGRPALIDEIIQLSWIPPDPLPFLPFHVVPPSVTVTGTNPPFGHLDTIIDPWVGDPPLPILPYYGIPLPGAVSNDNPPFGHLDTIIDPWVGDPPLPILPPTNVIQVRVDVPPGGLPIDLIAIDLVWTVQSPTQIAHLIVPPAAGGDNPPFGQLDTIIEPWVVDLLLPVLPTNVIPSSVDVPPGGLPIDLIALDFPWATQLPTQIAHLIPPPPARDNPPFGHLDTIIDPWVGDPPLPILPFHGIPVNQTSKPPVSHPGRTALINEIIQLSWVPPEPLPTLPIRSVLLTQSNRPPVTHPGRTVLIDEIIQTYWIPPDPLPTLMIRAIIPTVIINPDNPPKSHPGRTATINEIILNAWIPPDHLPRVNPPVVIPPTVVVSADNVMRRIASQKMYGIMRGTFEARPLDWDDLVS